MRRDRERLTDILQAIDRISTRPDLNLEQLIEDEMLQVWVFHHVWIIGEAVTGISTELRSLHPEVPWAALVDRRNILIHQYFRIDPERVWAFVKQELPVLKAQIEGILAGLGEEGDTIQTEE